MFLKNVLIFCRRFDVNVFGIWVNFLFKIFVKLWIDKNKLMEELKRINCDFFEKYYIEIENGKFVEKYILKQGDFVMWELLEREEKYVLGIFGGFVIIIDSERKIYVLLCNYIFLLNNQFVYVKVF